MSLLNASRARCLDYKRGTYSHFRILVKEGSFPDFFLGFPIHEIASFDWSSKGHLAEITTVVELRPDPDSLVAAAGQAVRDDAAVRGGVDGRGHEAGFHGVGSIVEHESLFGDGLHFWWFGVSGHLASFGFTDSRWRRWAWKVGDKDVIEECRHDVDPPRVGRYR